MHLMNAPRRESCLALVASKHPLVIGDVLGVEVDGEGAVGGERGRIARAAGLGAHERTLR